MSPNTKQLTSPTERGSRNDSFSGQDEPALPLVRTFVNLRMFPNMPLDVVRFRDSALASTPEPEAFRCAVLLFCSSWHQVPAASLPDDDKELAKLAGFGRAVREWRKHRDEALRGWLKCCDGRLYHPVVAEKANEAWESHLRHGWHVECTRIKKAAQRLDVKATYPTFEAWTEQYQRTGETRWKAPIVPTPKDDCPPGHDGIVPGEIASNRTERNGTERNGDLKSFSDTSLSAERTRSLAKDLARAAAGIGFDGCSASAPEIVRAAEVGITPDELRAAAKGMKPGKPLGYLVGRAIGKRTDAADLGNGAAGDNGGQPAVDPARAAALEERRKLEDSLIALRHDVEHERIGKDLASERAAPIRERLQSLDAVLGGLVS